MSCEIKILRITKTTQFGEDLQVKFWEGSWEIRESVTDQATWEAKLCPVAKWHSGEKAPKEMYEKVCLFNCCLHRDDGPGAADSQQSSQTAGCGV